MAESSEALEFDWQEALDPPNRLTLEQLNALKRLYLLARGGYTYSFKRQTKYWKELTAKDFQDFVIGDHFDQRTASHKNPNDDIYLGVVSFFWTISTSEGRVRFLLENPDRATNEQSSVNYKSTVHDPKLAFLGSVFEQATPDLRILLNTNSPEETRYSPLRSELADLASCYAPSHVRKQFEEIEGTFCLLRFHASENRIARSEISISIDDFDSQAVIKFSARYPITDMGHEGVIRGDVLQVKDYYFFFGYDEDNKAPYFLVLGAESYRWRAGEIIGFFLRYTNSGRVVAAKCVLVSPRLVAPPADFINETSPKWIDRDDLQYGPYLKSLLDSFPAEKPNFTWAIR